MTELRSRLERLSERVRAAPDAFERLERARHRREARRRIAAAVVALLVAVAGTIGAFAALGGRGSRPVGPDDEAFFALWPDQTAADLAAALERVEAGDPEFAWRTDPIEVARRFATEALLWPDAQVELQPGSDPAADNSVVAVLSVPAGSACNQLVADAECPGSSTTVTLERLGGARLWSVVEVRGEDLRFPLVPGQEVPGGTWITVPTVLPEGEKVSMGVQFLTACGEDGFDDNLVVRDGELELYVPAVPDGCTGYVYAMLPPTAAGAVSIGSFLFSDAEDRPGLGYLVEGVAAVPVRFVNEAPEVARFTCDGSGTLLPARAVVAAQPDGVHIAVTNTGDRAIAFSVAGLGGDEVEAGGRTENVWHLPPGDATLGCSPVGDAGSGVASAASLTVVDPNGHYVPTELKCGGRGVVVMQPDYPEDWLGYHGDPVEAVRTLLTGLAEENLIERAGYPGSTEPIVRVVRDGSVVALVHLRSDGQGGWLLDRLERCDDPSTAFGWADEATQPYPRGWFEWCPEPPFLEPGSDWREGAAEAAARFVEAYTTGDEATLAALLDPSVPRDPGVRAYEFSVVVLAEGVRPVAAAIEARGGPLVRFGCGPDVDAYTVRVTIDDGTESASADFTVFLILREDGWKVWGVY